MSVNNTTDYLEVPQKNITLINFNRHLFLRFSDICGMLWDNKLNLGDLKNPDTKRIYSHFIILAVLEEYVKQHKNKPVIIYNIGYFSNIPDDPVCKHVEYILLKMSKILPITVYCTSVNVFDSRLETDVFDVITNSIAHKVKTKSTKNYTLQKIKEFTKKHGLTYLNKDYLERLKTKHVLIH